MLQKFASSIVIASLFAPMIAVAADATPTGGREQDFILTAYYSPLPNQCCYIKGSEEADKVLNGNGTHGADGSPVYPGMLAAPSSYAFGTRIVLPGLGIMTVHDRGGAIQELDNADRLDVWAGYGEEGLARALAFGVQHIHGTVYPPASQPPAESIDLASLPAPLERLKPYIVAEAGMIDVQPKAGEKGLSVTMLQKNLAAVGLFTGEATGLFGDETKKALAAFQKKYGLEGDGTTVDETTSAYLMAATGMDEKKQDPVSFVNKESSVADVQSAQRLLRYFGYYRGRTDGKYSDTLFSAILKFQQEQKLVADAGSPGAGRIGPQTRSKLVTEWQKRMVAQRAKKLIALKKIGDVLLERDQMVSTYVSSGQNGKSVTITQEFLAAAGFFDKKSINGNFGPLTKAAIIKYQMDRGLIQSETDEGAGTVGPMTLRRIQNDQVDQLYRVVRAEGWGSI
jgi:peptidoglycan hydrolase-like protein with peptidoglycan-binding domain